MLNDASGIQFSESSNGIDEAIKARGEHVVPVSDAAVTDHKRSADSIARVREAFRLPTFLSRMSRLPLILLAFLNDGIGPQCTSKTTSDGVSGLGSDAVEVT